MASTGDGDARPMSVRDFARAAAGMLQDAYDHWCCAGILKNQELLGLLDKARDLGLIGPTPPTAKDRSDRNRHGR